MWAVIGWKLKAWIDFLAAALIDNIFFESNADAYMSFDCELMGYFWLNFLHLCIRQVLDLPYSLYFGFGWCVTNTKQYTERAQCIVPIVSLVFLRNAERLHYVFYFTLGSPGSSAPWPTESTQYRHKSGIGNMNRMGIWRIRHAMATTNSRGIWIFFFAVCVCVSVLCIVLCLCIWRPVPDGISFVFVHGSTADKIEEQKAFYVRLHVHKVNGRIVTKNRT